MSLTGKGKESSFQSQASNTRLVSHLIPVMKFFNQLWTNAQRPDNAAMLTCKDLRKILISYPFWRCRVLFHICSSHGMHIPVEEMHGRYLRAVGSCQLQCQGLPGAEGLSLQNFSGKFGLRRGLCKCTLHSPLRTFETFLMASLMKTKQTCTDRLSLKNQKYCCMRLPHLQHTRTQQPSNARPLMYALSLHRLQHFSVQYSGVAHGPTAHDNTCKSSLPK